MADVDLAPPFEAYAGTDPFIFVSYAHKDARTVFPEIARLHLQGYRIWYDEGVDPGNEWPDEVAKALARAAYFIVFVSPDAVQSQNVRNEINYALNKHKPFLAIHAVETQLPPGLELRMGDIQAILRYRMGENTYRARLTRVLPVVLLESSPADSGKAAPTHPDIKPDSSARNPAGPGSLTTTVRKDSLPGERPEESAEQGERFPKSVWQIGERNLSNAEFDTEERHEHKGNLWPKLFQYDLLTAQTGQFPGLLCRNWRTVGPTQVEIRFSGRTVGPARITIRFIGDGPWQWGQSEFSIALDGEALSAGNVKADRAADIVKVVGKNTTSEPGGYIWVEKTFLSQEPLATGRHSLSLTQQNGCVKIDYVRLDDMGKNC